LVLTEFSTSWPAKHVNDNNSHKSHFISIGQQNTPVECDATVKRIIDVKEVPWEKKDLSSELNQSQLGDKVGYDLVSPRVK